MGKSLGSHLKSEARGSLGDYEEVIRQIREVMAVRVIAGESGEIEEIHVLAGNGRGPKQIVRDIESSLMARFGVSIDHKKISVAQVEEGSSQQSWGTGRPRLIGVRFTVDASRAEAEVQVEFDDVVHTGRADGPATALNKLRVVAEATLGAIGEYFNSNCQLALDDVEIVGMRSRRIVLTVMSLLTESGEEILTGTSLVKGAEADAIARSVMDALNRRFTMVVRKPGSRPAVTEPDPG
ncbi:MAG: hypothetical protein C4551_05420 [Bacillota bacterium]|jgi:hypothetical protein|nr:MAG: hypothetical protein C4551_05420 [Bacillota bacterium]